MSDLVIKDAVRGEEPLMIALIGVPGGGKTFSMLRLLRGMARVRKGPAVVVDTEGGRSSKYAPAKSGIADGVRTFDFKKIELAPPFRSHRFLEAIKLAETLKPSGIGIDSGSDEHIGSGGYLEFHGEEVPRSGGNEWAAWAKPSASRRVLLSGLWHIKTPMIFTFRCKEKSEQKTNERGKKVIESLGWMPLAPLEIIHSMDLVCILPPRANGKPEWRSDKLGEDFVLKLPDYLRDCIKGEQLNEDTGEALARWALGDSAPAPSAPDPAALIAEIKSLLSTLPNQDQKKAALAAAFGLPWAKVQALDAAALSAGLDKLRSALSPGLVAGGPPAGPAASDYRARIRGRAEQVGLPVESIAAVIGGPLDDLPADLETMALAKIGEWSDEKGA